MSRKNVTYNQPLEKKVGFARAVRIGNSIAVTGTAPIVSDVSYFSLSRYSETINKKIARISVFAKNT